MAMRRRKLFSRRSVGAQLWPGQRHVNMESIHEYGSRVGFWQLWRMFTERIMPATVYGVASTMARNPQAVAAMNEASTKRPACRSMLTRTSRNDIALNNLPTAVQTQFGLLGGVAVGGCSLALPKAWLRWSA